MAMDGLLPPIFSKVDSTGNLRMGALISGIGMTVLATFVPFHYLNDLISAGILVAFSITNSSLVLLRCEEPPSKPGFLRTYLLAFNVLCFLTGLVMTRGDSTLLSLSFATLTIACFLRLWRKCPKSSVFGGSIFQLASEDKTPYFEVPLVPWLPCIGIFINWCLIAQLSWQGLLMLVAYIGLTVVCYVGFCGNEYGTESSRWRQQQQAEQQGYESIAEAEVSEKAET
eukprot:CAMPEP_0116549958 /NCGR_PEP_ID=MMETSP0397-20121206/5164_1 /TAXON_ID=216820 /ORGANISM="Cyclophora tenuis, Strain ECT3854" /LENGTH=226 /DNA_ID=CAMNT_0004074743 /DNA_START=378 /DNA_END=1058 /DNA_ORIENTATION=-